MIVNDLLADITNALCAPSADAPPIAIRNAIRDLSAGRDPTEILRTDVGKEAGRIGYRARAGIALLASLPRDIDNTKLWLQPSCTIQTCADYVAAAIDMCSAPSVLRDEFLIGAERILMDHPETTEDVKE
jgi:hypothetical protein